MALLLATLAVHVAQAHPADMYFQVLTVHLTSESVRVEWVVSPGVLLASEVWIEADQDQDDQVSPEEARGWVESRLPTFSANLDGTTPLLWQLESVEWPTSFDAFQLGDETIHIHLAASWPANPTGTHQLELYNQFQEAASTNWFYLHASEGATFHPPVQQNGRLTADVVFTPVASESSKADSLNDWESGTPSIPGVAGAVGLVSRSPESLRLSERGTRAMLTELLRTPQISPVFLLVTLAIATALGALHALTPGHGKAVVAAYLVGSSGTIWQAVALGSVVTLTHTGSVLALGLVTLVASRYILPTTLFPVLELASGLLIVGLGAGLLVQYGQAWRRSVAERRRDRPPPPTYERNPETGGLSITINQPVRERGLPHTHDRAPIPAPASRVSWRSLLALGVSGGLVPCPDAIAILLIAVTINRVALGLSLIVTFSLGLAAVLIAVGLTVVQGKHLLRRLTSFDRLATIAPFASAFVVLGLGIALTLSAVRSTGLFESPEMTKTMPASAEVEPRSGEPELRPSVRPFQVDQASVLYLAPDEQYRRKLYTVSLAVREPIPLAQALLDVVECALSPDGTTAVCTVLRQDGGTDLWAINTDGSDRRKLVDCSGFACGKAVWAPDGQRLVYDKRDLTANTDVAFPTLWWLDLTTEETRPMFQDSRFPGFNASWSPDGKWLSYVSPGSGRTQIYNLEDGRSHSVPNRIGEPVIWGPRGESVLVTDIRETGKRQIAHLLRYDITSGQLVDLTGSAEIEDLSASWSPDGEWIVAARRALSDSNPLKGDELWLMRPDGSQARPLTNDLGFLHRSPAWSPDGAYLLFHRYSLTETIAQPEIWLLEIATGEQQQVVKPGARPCWLP